MNQGVIIALLVLAALSILRLTNLPPFSSNSNTSQPSTSAQASPTPITRSTGFSTGVATRVEVNPLTNPAPVLPKEGATPPPETTPKPAFRAW